MRDWSIHTPYSEPGRHRLLLQQLPDQVDAISAAARNVIGHYCSELADRPNNGGMRSTAVGSSPSSTSTRTVTLAPWTNRETYRTGSPAAAATIPCSSSVRCANGASRPATASAFAGYLLPGSHLDHVIVEYWDQTRWRRTAPRHPALRPHRHVRWPERTVPDRR